MGRRLAPRFRQVQASFPFVDKAGTTAKAVAPPLPTEFTTYAPASLPHSVFQTSFGKQKPLTTD